MDSNDHHILSHWNDAHRISLDPEAALITLMELATENNITPLEVANLLKAEEYPLLPPEVFFERDILTSFSAD